MITTIEQAKKLKELGFNEPTHYTFWNRGNEGYKSIHLHEDYWNVAKGDMIAQPTISEALQWIRENHLICWVQFDYIDGINWYGTFIKNDSQMSPKHTDCFKSYPLAESALLDAVLDYLIEKKDE